MDMNIMLQIVEYITKAADELLYKPDRNLLEEGKLIAYAEALCVIQDSLLGYDLSVIGMDFDVDKRYLYSSHVSRKDVADLKIKALSRKRRLHMRLAAHFHKVLVYDVESFQKPDGTVFQLSKFPGEEALVVEYAKNYEDALLNRFEDGDVFYLDEMTEEEMFQAIMHEIED